MYNYLMDIPIESAEWRNTRKGIWHRAIKTKRNGIPVTEWAIYYEKTCAFCGENCLVKLIRHKYCSIDCGNKGAKRFGNKSNRWKGGRANIASGYVMLLISRNPRRYVFEHRHIMEILLKRSLTTSEIVHHKNGIRNDNRVENLEVMTRAAHCLLHEPRSHFLQGNLES